MLSGVPLPSFYAIYRQESLFPREKALSFQSSEPVAKNKGLSTRGLDENWFGVG